MTKLQHFHSFERYDNPPMSGTVANYINGDYNDGLKDILIKGSATTGADVSVEYRDDNYVFTEKPYKTAHTVKVEKTTVATDKNNNSKTDTDAVKQQTDETKSDGEENETK